MSPLEYVCAPFSTVDIGCASGSDIEIEIRPEVDVTETWFTHRVAPKEVRVYNPCFDVTDGSLISAIITEKGVLRPPYTKSLHEATPPRPFRRSQPDIAEFHQDNWEAKRPHRLF